MTCRVDQGQEVNLRRRRDVETGEWDYHYIPVIVQIRGLRECSELLHIFSSIQFNNKFV